MVFYIVASGLNVLNADQSKPVMVSLRQKGVLYMATGVHSLVEWPHVIHDDIADYVRENSEYLFDKDFYESPQFNDRVLDAVNLSTNWRNW